MNLLELDRIFGSLEKLKLPGKMRGKHFTTLFWTSVSAILDRPND